MSRGAVGRAVRGGLGRRRVQAIVIGLAVLVSTGASVLALGLIEDSRLSCQPARIRTASALRAE